MATTRSIQSLSVEDVTVVDADSHLREDIDDLVAYMDDRSAARRMIETATDVKSQVYTLTRASPSFPNNRRNVDGKPDPTGFGVDDPEAKVAFMDEFAIDYSVLTPGINVALASVNHDQTAVELASAYNTWLAANWLDTADRLYASALVANQKPDKAAEEIDRMADESDVVGVQFPATGLVPPAGHERYDPIYKAAQDHDLPIMMHSGNNASATVFPVQRRWSETFTEDHAFSFPAESMWHLISLTCRGVVERFPEVTFVMQEPGFEWVPWLMWRLDDHYLQNSEDLPMLRKPPSEYIRDRFHFTTQPLGHTEDIQQKASMIELAGGAETLLFSSDHPHPDFDPPSELFTPLQQELDEDLLRGVMGRSARDLFELS